MLSKYTLYVVPVELSLFILKLKETNLILSNEIQQLLLLLKQTHQMMAEGKRRRRKLKPMEEAIQFSLLQKDKNGLDGRFISDFKGELNVLIEQS